MQPSPESAAASSALNAQRAAIQEARARYERGELTFEDFRRALDALVLARDAEECAVILRELPRAPATALAALDPAPAVPAPATSPTQQRIVAIMSTTKRLRRSWQLAEETHALAFMGELKLDLSLAELPPTATLRVTSIMGTVIIYIPRNVRATIRSTILLSDATALGENTGGVITFSHEEHTPPTTTAPDAAPPPQLTIEAFLLMSNFKVVLTDGPVVSVSELVRDALRAAAEGVRRGLLQGPSQPPSLDSRSGR